MFGIFSDLDIDNYIDIFILLDGLITNDILFQIKTDNFNFLHQILLQGPKKIKFTKEAHNQI